MGWFGKVKPSLEGADKVSRGAGVFRKCDGCDATMLTETLESNLLVCPHCSYHYRMSADQWANLLLDPDSFDETDADLTPADPLSFSDGKRYTDRARAAERSSGTNEAFRTGSAAIHSRRVHVGFFLFEYMGGSMGSVVGEKLTRMFERAAQERVPAIVLSASGGARMQEGILSLMQMAKTVAALSLLRQARQPFVSLLTHPTTGGVAASYALLGDVNLAEPQALVGFAGPRVIEQTIRQKLPQGFQRSEFLLEHGMIDCIVERSAMRDTISNILSLLLDA